MSRVAAGPCRAVRWEDEGTWTQHFVVKRKDDTAKFDTVDGQESPEHCRMYNSDVQSRSKPSKTRLRPLYNITNAPSCRPPLHLHNRTPSVP